MRRARGIRIARPTRASSAMIRTLRAAALLVAGLLAACAPDSPRTAVPSGAAAAADAPGQALGFLRRGPAAPPFHDEEAVLHGVAGLGGEVTLRFADGSPFATFRVGAETLRGATLRGAPLADGTPVRIRMAPADGERFVVVLEPAGLRFNPAAPAELVFHYRHALPGRARGAPEVWRQEAPGEAWQRVGGTSDPQAGTLRAPLDGFTRYAAAYGG